MIGADEAAMVEEIGSPIAEIEKAARSLIPVDARTTVSQASSAQSQEIWGKKARAILRQLAA